MAGKSARNDIIDNDFTEKEKKFLSQINRSEKSLNNSKGQEYMSDPDTIEFMDAMVDRAFKKIGRPYSFESNEQLNEDINEFIALCYRTSTIPTIASAGLWLGCDRDTIYNHANNSNSPFFGTCKNLINLCHVSMENGAIKNKMNSVLYMFLSKNYFGLKDDKNIKVTAANDSLTPNAQETAEALRKQLEEETIPNATILESD